MYVSATDKERMVLQALQDIMLEAKCDQGEMYTITIMLMANLLLGILRDIQVPGGEAQLISDTVKSIRSGMEMFRHVKAAEERYTA